MKIAITGIGVVSTFGVGREVFWDHVRRGVSGTRAITEFDATTYPCQVAAAVPPVTIDDAQALDGETHGNGNGERPRRSEALLARGALRRARRARSVERCRPRRLASPTPASSSAPAAAASTSASGSIRTSSPAGGKHVTPYAIAVGICGMVSSEISISLGLHGISHVLSTGCTSSTDAIGYAAMLLQSGEVDVLLTGGTDGCVLPGMIFGFSRMRAVSTHYNDRPDAASRPFDRGRDGFVLGEGAWMLALERLDRARARGARVYATVDGYASTCDAYHRVQMDPDGEQIVRCMTQALSRAGRQRRGDRLRQLSRHVDAAERRDRIEVHARGCSARAPIACPGSSTKSMIGHPQGASGAAGVVTTALALSRGFLPPTINLTDPDPQLRSGLSAQPGPRRAAGGGLVQLPRVRIEELGARAGSRLRHCSGRTSRSRLLEPWLAARAAKRRPLPVRMTDVIIVGAGPAGSLAATILARAGVRVRVFDRARFPRPSCAATRSIPARCACSPQHMPIDPILARGLPLDGMVLTGPGGVRGRRPLPGHAAGPIDRARRARSLSGRAGRARRRCDRGGRQDRPAPLDLGRRRVHGVLVSGREWRSDPAARAGW